MAKGLFLRHSVLTAWNSEPAAQAAGEQLIKGSSVEPKDTMLPWRSSPDSLCLHPCPHVSI